MVVPAFAGTTSSSRPTLLRADLGPVFRAAPHHAKREHDVRIHGGVVAISEQAFRAAAKLGEPAVPEAFIERSAIHRGLQAVGSPQHAARSALVPAQVARADREDHRAIVGPYAAPAARRVLQLHAARPEGAKARQPHFNFSRTS